MSEAAEQILADGAAEQSVPCEPCAQQENLTQEQKVWHVKNNLRRTLAIHHNSTFNFVSGLPINEDQKKFALANLIQALHWVEDGIEALQFEVESLGDINATEEGAKPESNQSEHPQGNEVGQTAEASGCNSLENS